MPTASAASTATKSPPPAAFPRVFYVANTIELLERLAFYGVYINLSVYLTGTVGLTDVENGTLLGLFAVGRSWLPVPVGALADRVGFRRSLLVAFALYALAYLALYTAPTRAFAYLAIAGMSLGGAFMKPVITGCVKRYSPPGRETQGFSVFYATVNAGSVVGKVLAKQVRTAVSLRATVLTSIVASVVAGLVALGLFAEPPVAKTPAPAVAPSPSTTSGTGILRAYFTALREPRLAGFLLLVSGYYLLIEQFYQTFPVYMLRVLGPSAPREYVTLVNPLSIALLQVAVTRVTARLAPLAGIVAGIALGAASMLAMGLAPSLAGACGAFFVFALAEMVFSPRFYSYVASFAPRGREGMYMGLALLPSGLGGLAGGVLSGRLIARYLPEHGPHRPLAVWGVYAAIGLGCAVMLALYRALAREPGTARSD